jgi:hypothetical protein
MLIRRSQALADFGTSVAWGCLAGGLGIALVNNGLPSWDKWWLVPASPIAATGLALIGVPIAALLRPYAENWWVAVLAAATGALAGELAFLALKQLDPGVFGQVEGRPGIMVGIPTALSWWWLRRSAVSNAN